MSEVSWREWADDFCCSDNAQTIWHYVSIAVGVSILALGVIGTLCTQGVLSWGINVMNPTGALVALGIGGAATLAAVFAWFLRYNREKKLTTDESARAKRKEELKAQFETARERHTFDASKGSGDQTELNTPKQMLPQIYLGNLLAKEKASLHSIVTVINLGERQLDDDKSTPPITIWREKKLEIKNVGRLFRYLDEALLDPKGEKNTLVVCKKGGAEAPTLLALYLMNRYHYTWQQALGALQSVFLIATSEESLKTLQEYEKSLGERDATPT